VLDTPVVRSLIADVQATIAESRSAAAACDALGAPFARLLADRTWLPDEYQRDAPDSGMGGGIGQWLLYRAADRSLCLFSLAFRPGR